MRSYFEGSSIIIPFENILYIKDDNGYSYSGLIIHFINDKEIILQNNISLFKSEYKDWLTKRQIKNNE